MRQVVQFVSKMSDQGQVSVQSQDQVEGRVYYDDQGRVQGQVQVQGRRLPAFGTPEWSRATREQGRDLGFIMDFNRYPGNHEQLAAAHGLEGLTGLALGERLMKVED